MRVVAVINRGGGSIAGVPFDETGIKRAFDAAGVDAAVVLADPNELTRALVAALERGPDAVVVGGGDGSISAAAGVLAGTNTPLGVLPLGTANHFAKDLGLPLSLEEAAQAIARCSIRPLSVGEVNGRVFINNSILGFYPHVVKARSALRRRFPVNKILARWMAAAQVFPSFPLISLELEAEGRTRTCTTPFLFVGAQEYAMNAFSFGAPARSDQGRLFVYLVRRSSRAALLKLFLMGFIKDVRQEQHFETWSAPQLTIRTDDPTVTVFADGELFEMQPPLRYRSLPGALRVIVPEDGKGRKGESLPRP